MFILTVVSGDNIFDQLIVASRTEAIRFVGKNYEGFKDLEILAVCDEVYSERATSEDIPCHAILRPLVVPMGYTMLKPTGDESIECSASVHGEMCLRETVDGKPMWAVSSIDEVWVDGESQECVAYGDSLPEVLDNRFSDYEETADGFVVYFEDGCYTGRQLKGEVLITCADDLEWELRLPDALIDTADFWLNLGSQIL